MPHKGLHRNKLFVLEIVLKLDKCKEIVGQTDSEICVIVK
jgi:hypothetical protein